MSARPVLVTGATGFLGRALTRRLLALGRPVVALTRAGSDLSSLKDAVVELYDGDGARLLSIVEERKPETVFHLAAASEGGVDEIVKANVLLGAQLAEACVKAGVEKLIAAGTFFTRRSGGDDYDPVSLYAATKKAQEAVFDYYVRAHGLKAAIVCLYDLYGPGDERPKLLNLLARSAAGPELALSPGDQELDVVHVDDAVEALLAAEKAASPGPLREWCASSGKRVTVKRLVELFRRETGLSPKVAFGAKPYRDREVMKPWAGVPVPGWKPAIPLEEGLRRVYGGKAAS